MRPVFARDAPSRSALGLEGAGVHRSYITVEFLCELCTLKITRGMS